MARLLLKFPFTIDGRDREALVETPVERSQAYVSFALPYELTLSIANADAPKKTPGGTSTIYVFEFHSLDAALEWADDPVVNVEYGRRNGNPRQIEDEMNAFMRSYETKEKASKRKKMVEDEDGFVHYE